jgi:hypothetical protein
MSQRSVATSAQMHEQDSHYVMPANDLKAFHSVRLGSDHRCRTKTQLAAWILPELCLTLSFLEAQTIDESVFVLRLVEF